MSTGGRQLDSEIAKKVFRYIVILENAKGGEPYIIRARDRKKLSVPRYSSDSDAAYQIVNHFQKKNYFVKINSQSVGDGSSEWMVAFYFAGENYQYSRAKTFPEAVCMAALAVLDGSNKLHYKGD